MYRNMLKGKFIKMFYAEDKGSTGVRSHSGISVHYFIKIS